MSKPNVILVTDTSVLVNFLRIDRMDLLHALSHDFLVTEHAAAEVTELYADQLSRFEAALASGCFQICRVESDEALDLFGQLTGTSRLGVGESATIAHALSIGAGIAIDDRRAINEARRVSHDLTIVGTVDLAVEMIRQGLLTRDEADAIKDDWAKNHRFRVKFGSFAELL